MIGLPLNVVNLLSRGVLALERMANALDRFADVAERLERDS